MRWPHGKSGGLVDRDWEPLACYGVCLSTNNDCILQPWEVMVPDKPV